MAQKDVLMKVCFVGSARYRRPLNVTDEKKFQALKELGELFVISFSQDLLPHRFTQYARFYLLPQLPGAVLRYVEVFVVGTVLSFWSVFRHKVRVLVAQSPYEGVAAAVVKKIAGVFGRKVVLVVESHGDFEEGLFMQRKLSFPAFYRFLMNSVARFTFRHANILRAVSHSTRKQLERWKPGYHVFQFFTWTDIEVFQQVGSERENHFSQTLLYAGVLVPRKGVVHLVKAFAAISADFPQARLVIIGKEENRTYAAEVKALVKTLGQDRRVQFLANLSQPQLAQQMGQANAFVLPTYSEGLPRVVFEAMSAGLPVIATAVSGIPEIVQECVTGILVQPGDETALAEKMRWVLEHPEASQEMGRKAHAFACSFFSTEAYLQGYRQIFEVAQRLLNHDQTDTI